ncbi:MAG: LOW QUALITY PROTEIN: von Willebrand factor type A domain-containing protein [Benniella sp.]|nr:MAG: LOW QUALITY PROTEIN: von Willebrand factor type A domain-containing protein [Benniella sp.]
MTSQLYGLHSQRQSLPLAHTVILETISRTTLTQTYLNPSASDPIPELRYAFPLYDGVSVVGFTCRIGDRTIERQRAKKDFKDAVLRGDKAALLEQLPSASDVFTTTVGNIPAGAKVITYIGELKHDAEVNGIRFTIPTSIMPRYVELSRLQVTVDVVLAQSNKVQSPSHPITVSLGTTSFAPNADAALSKASATLCLGDAALDKDFIIQVDTGMPTAILETHPTIPNQRALMATLVPKFALPAEKPEVVGSMQGSNINLVRSALKSLPVGIKFNICYFGSSYSFLWPKSATYSQTTLDEAIKHAESISANMGGTEMFQPIKATLDQRYKDIPLAVMLLTDGEIWNQESLFTYLNKEIIEPKAPIRVFTLGIGNGVSHALIEGVAKAGNGFSQSVGEGEKMEGKVVRMLKAALTPHVSDYTLEVKYTSSEVKDKDKDMDMDDDDDFEIVEKVVDGLNVKVDAVDGARVGSKSASTEMKPISLFDPSVDPDSDVAAPEDIDTDEARFAGLPMVTPKLLQSPHIIPPLYAFNRTNVYLLMTHQSSSLTPKSVVLRGVSRHGPLEIEIPIQILDTPGETIHQLGAKSAIAELEQGRGWITQLKDESDGQLFRQKYESRFSDMVEREAVRLGVQFQVGGKWCSFVATETRKERDDDATLNEIGVEVEDKEREAREIIIVKETEKTARRRFIGKRFVVSSCASLGYSSPPSAFPHAPLAPSSPADYYSSDLMSMPSAPQSGALKNGVFSESFSSKSQQFSSAFTSAQAFPRGTGAESFRDSSAFYGLAGPRARGFGEASDATDAIKPIRLSPRAPSAFRSASSALETFEDISHAPLSQAFRSTPSAPEAPRSLSPGAFGSAAGAPGAFGSARPVSFGSAAPVSLGSAAPVAFGSAVPVSFGSAVPVSFGSAAAFGSTAGAVARGAESTVHGIIGLQTFEGYWEWQASLLSCVGVDPVLAAEAVKKHGWDLRVAATGLAIVFLEKKKNKEKDAWELVVEKAKGWMEEQIGANEAVVLLYKISDLVK